MEVEAAAGSAIASEDRTVAGASTSTIEIKDDFTAVRFTIGSNPRGNF